MAFRNLADKLHRKDHRRTSVDVLTENGGNCDGLKKSGKTVSKTLRSYRVLVPLLKKSKPQNVDSANVPLLSGGLDAPDVANLDKHAVKLIQANRVSELRAWLLEDKHRLTQADSDGYTVLHLAVKHDRIEVVHMLKDFCTALHWNERTADGLGQTPVHVAVQTDLPGMVDTLCQWPAVDVNLRNTAGMTPHHLATMLKHHLCLQVLLDCPRVDVNEVQTGKHCGGTALHICAVTNDTVAAKMLLEKGAKFCQPCTNGFYPIHVAARFNSSEVLEMLVLAADKLGYSREHVLGFSTKDAQSPLIMAVNNHNLEAMDLCLRLGASSLTRQADGQTVLHLAAGIGDVDVVEFLWTKCHAEQPALLTATDKQGKTALHRAAMFNHHGFDVNAVDSDGQTAMMNAAKRGAFQTVQILMSNKEAQVELSDTENRNLMHLLVYANNYSPLVKQIVRDVCQKPTGPDLLNEKEHRYGLTPLHLAAKKGNLQMLDVFLSLGARVGIKDSVDQSPLHFAARYGRLRTVERLLDCSHCMSVLNELNSDGKTALHVASEAGHVKVLQLLLKKGALLLRDFHGRTPLHLAAENGYAAVARILVAMHKDLLDAVDRKGNTALHFACRYNQSNIVKTLLGYDCAILTNSDGFSPMDVCIKFHHKNAALAMVKHKRWMDVVYVISPAYEHVMLGLTMHLPEVCSLVLDRCIKTTGDDPKSKDYCITYDFKFLQASQDLRYERIINPVPADEHGFVPPAPMPLIALNRMVEYGRVGLLSHPLCLKFLDTKWATYGFAVHSFNLGSHILYILLLLTTVFGVDLVQKQPVTLENENLTISSEQSFQKQQAYYSWPPPLSYAWLSSVLLAVMVMANCCKELAQMFRQRFAYLTDAMNYLEWLLYVSTLIFIFPIIATGQPSVWAWQFGAIAVWISWYNLLLYLQKTDSFGIYITMFLQILSTVIKVSAVFTIIFIAFGLAFFMLFAHAQTNESTSDVFLSIINTVSMMMGDLGFNNHYVIPYLNHRLSYPVVQFMFLLVFVAFIPVLFINLLIGLAVGDIERVQRDAKLKRLATQVAYHTELEDRWLPWWLLLRADRQTVAVYPNRTCSKLKSGWRSFMGNFGGDLEQNPACNDETMVWMRAKLGDTRKKIRDMQRSMDRQNDMLRLIVQKLEIVNERDEQDEGNDSDCSDNQ